MTEKLYYRNSHMRDFSARVVSCVPLDGGYAVVLNRTAFFPSGGGQAADVGEIQGTAVINVFEKGGEIVHITKEAIKEGARVRCSIEWETRFRRMQNHSGEHIVSGIIHRLFGYENVGFHMGENLVTIDFSGELNAEDIKKVERIANMTIYRNLPVNTAVYSQKELESLDFRSKLEFSGDVRIVSIEGVDRCACCAPHVDNTGEVGIIKILDVSRHRGGVRLTMVCGLDALQDYCLRCENISAISAALSAKQLETAAAVNRILSEFETAKSKTAEAQRVLLKYKIDGLKPTSGNICLFELDMDIVCLRELVNAGMRIAGGVCAAFSGNDRNYTYIIGSVNADLRALVGEINTGLEGKGGGSKTMIQGTSQSTRKRIEDYFLTAKF